MPMWQINPAGYDFRHAVLPLPRGPHASEDIFAPGVADAIFIPANSAYPLGLIALDNFLFPLDEYEETLEEWIVNRAHDRFSYGVVWEVLENVDGGTAYLPQLPRSLVGRGNALWRRRRRRDGRRLSGIHRR